MLNQVLTSIVILLILLVFGILVSIQQWPELPRYIRSSKWPTIPGTVEKGEVSTLPGRGTRLVTAQLGYSYQLNGTYYSGYHTETFTDEQKARSYVDGLKGQVVQVSYNPRKPEISVLRRQQLLS